MDVSLLMSGSVQVDWIARGINWEQRKADQGTLLFLSFHLRIYAQRSLDEKLKS